MASTSPVFSGVLLILAGAYQWLPVKTACLNRCRSPLSFLGTEWREGIAGAVVMGEWWWGRSPGWCCSRGAGGCW